MSRMDDNSTDLRRWTNRKLMTEARRLANLESFGASVYEDATLTNSREEKTRIYRNTWFNPIMDEIERRFVKGAR